jgi:haloalkane dehalogenase
VDVVRTSDDRFTSLPDYPFDPRYADVDDGLRMHYVDEGPRDAAPVLLLHGQPTWSFLYRRVIADLAAAGHRAIAPDLIGFGRSDKPTDHTAHSLAAHIGWMQALVTALDLRDVTLVCQDWGGPIGLGVLAREPERFARVVATNTILHTADPALAGRTTWALHGVDGEQRVVVEEMLLDYILATQRYHVVASGFVSAATRSEVPDDVLAAYDAPFPDERHMVGVRQLPVLIPLTRNDPGAQINATTFDVLKKWTKPFHTAYSDGDPATAGWERVFGETVPGARDVEHVAITDAGHFIQEDKPHELAAAINAFIAAG